MNKKLRIINNVIMIIAIIVQVACSIKVLASDSEESAIAKITLVQTTEILTLCLFCFIRFKDDKDKKFLYGVFDTGIIGTWNFITAYESYDRARKFCDDENTERAKSANYESYKPLVVREVKVR